MGAERLIVADDIVEGTVAYLAETLGLKPNRVSRLDHRASAGRGRSVVFQLAARWPRRGIRGVQDGV